MKESNVSEPIAVEEWRPVVGYESSYLVSNLGRVKTLARVVDRGPRGLTAEPERIINGRNSAGYRRVYLSVAGIGSDQLVHRLVAAAFLGPCPEGMMVCHNDGVPDHNVLTNLRYDTYEGNAADRKRHGTEYKLSNTECPSGHPYDGANLILRPTESGVKRICRECARAGNREGMRRFKARKHAESAGLDAPTGNVIPLRSVQ